MKRRLSGWARLWVVIGALIVIGSTLIGFENARIYDEDQWGYVGTHITVLQYCLRIAQFVVGGLFVAVVTFVVAMIAKSAALWVYRGFKPPKSDASA